MKNVILICLMLASSAVVVFGQKTVEKKSKVVIIEKTIDENGNETTERIEKEGSGALDLLKEMGINIDDAHITMDIDTDSMTWTTDDGEIHNLKGKKIIMISDEDMDEEEIEKTITINAEGGGSTEKEVSVEIEEETKRKVKVKIKEDGEEEVIEWEDDGETPEDIQKRLDELGVEIDVRGKKKGKKKRMRIKGDKPHGNHWKKHDGDRERGHKTLEIAEEHIVILEGDEDISEMSAEEIFKLTKTEDKPRFGVMIADDNNGALVKEVIEGSVAETAGIKAGDIITKVNKTEIKSADGLIEAVQGLEAGKKTTFHVIRDGKEKKIKTKL